MIVYNISVTTQIISNYSLPLYYENKIHVLLFDMKLICHKMNLTNNKTENYENVFLWATVVMVTTES